MNVIPLIKKVLVKVSIFFLDKCATKICPSYQLCKIINNEAACVCLQRDKCSSDYNPVCGDNGKNYNNECLMKVAGCLAGNPDISVAKRGDCKYGIIFKIHNL